MKQIFNKTGLVLTFVLFFLVELNAQNVQKRFTVFPLNVDGLPASIAGIILNPDGPGEC